MIFEYVTMLCQQRPRQRGFFLSLGRDMIQENPSHSASVISSGSLPTDFLGPFNCYILPRIFSIRCITIIPLKISKLLVGTSGRLSAILPLYSVVLHRMTVFKNTL